MNGAMHPKGTHWAAKFQAVANTIGIALFLALLLVFVIQISARFVFNHPMAWTDELAVVLYLWVILWGAAFICAEREHVAFDLLANAVPARIQRAMRLVGFLILGGVLLYALPGTADYIWFMHREKTPVLDISFLLVFAPFLLFLLAWIARALWVLVNAARGECA